VHIISARECEEGTIRALYKDGTVSFDELCKVINDLMTLHQ